MRRADFLTLTTDFFFFLAQKGQTIRGACPTGRLKTHYVADRSPGRRRTAQAASGGETRSPLPSRLLQHQAVDSAVHQRILKKRFE